MPSSVKRLRIALPSCRVQQAIGNRLRQAERLRRLTKDAFAAAAATVEPLIDGTFKSSGAPTRDHDHRDELLAFQGSKLVAKAFAAFVPPELASSARLDCDYYGPTFVENATQTVREIAHYGLSVWATLLLLRLTGLTTLSRSSEATKVLEFASSRAEK